MGCIMMRVCHLDTCPVGVATQNPELRDKFTGDPDHIVNYMRFVAQEVREIMAELGFRNMDEMVGSTDVLQVSDRAKAHWKAKHLDLSTLLYQPEGVRTAKIKQNHKIDQSLDIVEILPAVAEAIETGTPIDVSFNIKNINRVAGTIVGSEISKRYGEEGLAEDTITLRFAGSAGQSFGAFVPKGVTMHLTGDSNDYIGKGLSGGKIIVTPPKDSSIVAADNVIIGNVPFYGATSGEAYINGRAGERFGVRNSGANVVVEGVGDHGCEYMTGGRVVILGEVGKNFGAGMSGGIAYVLADNKDQFKHLCNVEMIEFESLEDEKEIRSLEDMIQNHFNYTGSKKAEYILENWNEELPKFVKVIPKDYKRMMDRIAEQMDAGLTNEEAVMSAFEANAKSEKKGSVLKEARSKAVVQ
jgi:glutamate synthase (NADPH/NADH) large chain